MEEVAYDSAAFVGRAVLSGGSDAPNTSSIDESKAEEFVSSADLLGILAEFQGGNESTSTAGVGGGARSGAG